MNRADIERLIDVAFEGAPPEVWAESSEFQYPDYEGATVRNFFLGKRWQDLNFHEVKTSLKSPLDAALNFMPDNQALYYLPFFMKISLEKTLATDTSYDSALFFVTPNGRFKGIFHGKFFDQIPISAKKAIAQWLQYIIQCCANDGDNQDAEIAYSSYWSRFQ